MERGGRNDPRKLERRVSPRVDLPAMATNPSHRRGIERPRSEIPRGGDGRSDEATAPADWAGIAGESTPVERRIAHDASRCVDERSDRSEFRPVLPVRPFGCPGRDRAAGAKDRVSTLGTRDPRDTRSTNQVAYSRPERRSPGCEDCGTLPEGGHGSPTARTWQDEQRGARNRADRRSQGRSGREYALGRDVASARRRRGDRRERSGTEVLEATGGSASRERSVEVVAVVAVDRRAHAMRSTTAVTSLTAYP